MYYNEILILFKILLCNNTNSTALTNLRLTQLCLTALYGHVNIADILLEAAMQCIYIVLISDHYGIEIMFTFSSSDFSKRACM